MLITNAVITVECDKIDADHPFAARVADVLCRQLRERVGIRARVGRRRPRAKATVIELRSTAGDGNDESFAIATEGSVASPRVVISGNGRGLLYGVGWWLRALRRVDGRLVEWPRINTRQKPALAIRGIYFPTQTHAPKGGEDPLPFNAYNVWLWRENRFDDFEQALIELMLWGMNTIGLWYAAWMDAPWDDTPFGREMGSIYDKVVSIARSWGLKIALLMTPNLVPAHFFEKHSQHNCSTIPRGLWAQFSVPNTLCPSVPAVNRYTMEYNRRLIERYRPDWIELFPTDPGGCDCPKCRPWWKKYLELSEELLSPWKDTIPMRSINFWYFWNRDAARLAGKVARSEAINAVSTQGAWQEDTAARLRISDALAAKGKRIIFWPDITMIGGWGTWGTYPHIQGLQKLFALTDKVHGVLPYTEGRYDDINKFTMLSLAWNPRQEARALVRSVLEQMHNQSMPASAVDAVIAIENRDFQRARSRLAKANAKLDDRTRGDWRWYSLNYYARYAGIADRAAALHAELKAVDKKRPSAGSLARWSRQLDALESDLRIAAREMPTLYKKVNDFHEPHDMGCGTKLRDYNQMAQDFAFASMRNLLESLRGNRSTAVSSGASGDTMQRMNLHVSGKRKRAARAR